MKKMLVSLILGFLTHMLYLDYIQYQSTKNVDNCAVESTLDNLPECFTKYSETFDSYKGKSLGLYRLFKYNAVNFSSWELE